MFLGRTISVLQKAPEKFFDFFPVLPPQGQVEKKEFEFNRSVHTFGILRALVPRVNGCFISSYCGTVMGDKGLITFQTHYILIFIQQSIVLLITLSSIISNDISYHPNKLCLILMKNRLHVLYAIFAFYAIPLLMIIIIYLLIYCRLKKMKKNTLRRRGGSTHNEKRDVKRL